MSVRSASAVVVVALLSAGCSEKSAEFPTYPVSGEVVRAGKPAPGGTVQFVHQTEPGVRAVGEIGPDGRFTLSTLSGSEKRSGAVPGEYKAVLVFSASEPPVHPRAVFKVEPRENTFRIQLP